MEPTQLAHLKEAAIDIRSRLEGCLGMLVDVMNSTTDLDSKSTLEAIEYRMKTIERALTRIDMCLKEIK